MPALGVGLLAVAFVVNLLGNQLIGEPREVTAIINKVGGIAVFAGIGLWVSGLSFDITSLATAQIRRLAAGSAGFS